MSWRIIRDSAARGSARQRVADRAYTRLGIIVDELDPMPEHQRASRVGSS